MPTEHPFAMHIYTRQAIVAERRRRYETPLRDELQEVPRNPLLGRPWRAIRRTR